MNTSTRCSLFAIIAIGQEAQLPDKKSDRFDSNCITPGTPFMAHLAFCLRYYIAEKQNNDPLWKNVSDWRRNLAVEVGYTNHLSFYSTNEKLKVILSDATVPGEGEHKVMEFIRVQRSRPEHNPNTSHVMYGLVCDTLWPNRFY